MKSIVTNRIEIPTEVLCEMIVKCIPSINVDPKKLNLDAIFKCKGEYDPEYLASISVTYVTEEEIQFGPAKK